MIDTIQIIGFSAVGLFAGFCWFLRNHTRRRRFDLEFENYLELLNHSVHKMTRDEMLDYLTGRSGIAQKLRSAGREMARTTYPDGGNTWSPEIELGETYRWYNH